MSFLLSVVVPCYNEQEVIAATHNRLDAALAALDRNYEIVYVNDGSADGTLALLSAIAGAHSQIGIVNLARNFGHQAAVSAGLQYASGDAIVIIDADLQDPPELIGALLEKWEQGFQVVYGQRAARAGETWFKKATATLFYRLLSFMSDVKIPRDVGDFRLIDRRVADVIRQMPERHRFLRGMISWVGFRQCAVPYSRDPRGAGVTKYPLRRMLRFAADGLMSFSTVPLKLTIWSGLLSAAVAVTLILYAIVLRLWTDVWVSGWTLMIIAVAFFSGVQLVALGVIGAYVGRIFEEAKQRPLFVIEGLYGFGGKTPPSPPRP